MTSLQEYNLEIKSSKIFKGHGLCDLVAKNEKEKSKQYDGWKNEEFIHEKEICYIFPTSDTWYFDLDFLILHNFAPKQLTSK